MRKSTLVVVAVLSLFATVTASAQSRKNVKDSSTVIIFNQSSSSSSSARKSSGENNIIKIAPLGFIGGTFPLLYERRITDFFSVQVAGGLTSKNYFRTAIAKDNESGISYTYPWDDNGSDLSEHIYNFDYRKPKLGYMLSIQPRAYFQSEGLEGSFLGLSLDYYKYKFQIPGITNVSGNTKQTGTMQDEYENMVDYMVHFGSQALYDHLTFEYSTALGIRNVKGSKYAATTDANGNIMEGFATYKQTLFNYNLGIKVGYHF